MLKLNRAIYGPLRDHYLPSWYVYNSETMEAVDDATFYGDAQRKADILNAHEERNNRPPVYQVMHSPAKPPLAD